jgi:excisionase family DNA binding protein
MNFDHFLRSLVEELLEIRLEAFKKQFTEDQKAPQNPLLSRREAAKLLGCCLASLDNYVRQGRIEKYKTGRKTVFRRDDLLRLPV